MKNLKALFVGTALVASFGVMAQSVNDGKKLLNYERPLAAAELLQKISGNPEAQYWLGQALIEQKDYAAARKVYTEALQNNGSQPLLLVGMGHLELLENKTQDARQRFETAISLTKGKDVEVLNAVGRANADTKAGDQAYALEKLNQATNMKGFNNPETFLVMGDNYRRQLDGGNAVQSYMRILSMDSKVVDNHMKALANHRIGEIYLTQNNKEIFGQYFDNATAADITFAPVYLDWYRFYFMRNNLPEAKAYFDKYKMSQKWNAEELSDLRYDEADLLYLSKQYPQAINLADEIIKNDGAKVHPRIYKLKAYSFLSEGDSVSAKNSINNYFSKQIPDEIIPADYMVSGDILGRFPAEKENALAQYAKGAAAETDPAKKIDFLLASAELCKKWGDKSGYAKWMGEVYNTKPKANNTDLFNWGIAHYQAKEYTQAANVFKTYSEKYPDQTFGYLWQARSLEKVDSTMSQGLAIPAHQKLVEMMSAEPEKNKAQLLTSYGYLTGYYANTKKDYATALDLATKASAVDPSNIELPKIVEQLKKALANKK